MLTRPRIRRPCSSPWAAKRSLPAKPASGAFHWTSSSPTSSKPRCSLVKSSCRSTCLRSPWAPASPTRSSSRVPRTITRPSRLPRRSGSAQTVPAKTSASRWAPLPPRQCMRATWKTPCAARSSTHRRSKTPPPLSEMRSTRSMTCVARRATNAKWRESGRSGRCRSSSTAVPEATSSFEVLTRGPVSAQPVVFLHDLDYLNSADYPFIETLAERWLVICPSHPGFGGSPLPEGFDAIDDLAYFYLDFLREHGPAHVVGAGFGGWLAAEIAVRCTHHIRSLTLVDALGIKVGDHTTVDIKDLFVVSPRELLELCWHDTETGERQMALPTPAYDEATLTQLLTNRQTAALVGWNPF